MGDRRYNFFHVEESFRRVLRHSTLLPHDQWEFHLLINPGAGGFNLAGLRQTFSGSLPQGIRTLIDSSMEAVQNRSEQCSGEEVELYLHLSAYPGQAGHTASTIAESARHSDLNVMIVSIGGDGTHREIMDALQGHRDLEESSLCLFRFPLGSGNDAADAKTPEEAWLLLLETGGTRRSKALEIHYASRKIRRAYNIASLGIDAHIVRLTNHLKDRLPGNFYKFVTDISVPFYPRIYRIRDIVVKGRDAGGGDISLKFPLGLIAMGISGRRTYGHGLNILPSDENLCAIRLGGLGKNIRMKKALYESRHGDLDFVSLYSCSDLRVEYPGAVPIQFDGEVEMLDPRDFPLNMRVVDTDIPVFGYQKKS
ncbi:diacylglycerol/lipid kinase family protein [Salinispira pacifica]|uniref:DAGKc domain-containing protein n=1 Tax=Salinispira pacifica TaxID=1307761 RepID=V5WHR5_9SPIO|nr:diacylglycerol kinase family protein [Salinispira pacifica]AHC15069.1 hypothetical protein L21SP2_1686 [Salinispira pacifica]